MRPDKAMKELTWYSTLDILPKQLFEVQTVCREGPDVNSRWILCSFVGGRDVEAVGAWRLKKDADIQPKILEGGRVQRLLEISANSSQMRLKKQETCS